MATQLAAPRPLYGWVQPTLITNWTGDMLGRLPDNSWRYQLLEERVEQPLLH